MTLVHYSGLLEGAKRGGEDEEDGDEVDQSVHRMNSRQRKALISSEK